jgi:hypothetical protein
LIHAQAERRFDFEAAAVVLPISIPDAGYWIRDGSGCGVFIQYQASSIQYLPAIKKTPDV